MKTCKHFLLLLVLNDIKVHYYVANNPKHQSTMNPRWLAFKIFRNRTYNYAFPSQDFFPVLVVVVSDAVI